MRTTSGKIKNCQKYGDTCYLFDCPIRKAIAERMQEMGYEERVDLEFIYAIPEDADLKSPPKARGTIWERSPKKGGGMAKTEVYRMKKKNGSCTCDYEINIGSADEETEIGLMRYKMKKAMEEKGD